MLFVQSKGSAKNSSLFEMMYAQASLMQFSLPLYKDLLGQWIQALQLSI